MENPAVNLSVSAILANPGKWRTLLDQFEDILKINIFITDPLGNLVIPCRFPINQQGGGLLEASSDPSHYGASLLQTTFGIDFEKGGSAFFSHFHRVGEHLQSVDPFEFHLFAIPIKKEADDPIFYLIVGPVLIGQSWDEDKYLALAQSLGISTAEFIQSVRAVPNLSQLALNAVLDLLAEVVRDVYELSLEKDKMTQLQSHRDSVRPEILDTVQGLLTDIQNDELLISILDAAIKMSKAEGGSIMIFDNERQDFVIKVSRGLDTKKSVVESRFKIGEGIAGIAAQEKVPFFINGTEGDVRIQHLLKRPDIKHSFVVPILVGDMVIGVLNLSIKNQDSIIIIEDVQKDIQKLSPLIAAALRSL